MEFKPEMEDARVNSRLEKLGKKFIWIGERKRERGSLQEGKHADLRRRGVGYGVGGGREFFSCWLGILSY